MAALALFGVLTLLVGIAGAVDGWRGRAALNDCLLPENLTELQRSVHFSLDFDESFTFFVGFSPDQSLLGSLGEGTDDERQARVAKVEAFLDAWTEMTREVAINECYETLCAPGERARLDAIGEFLWDWANRGAVQTGTAATCADERPTGDEIADLFLDRVTLDS